MFRLAQTSPASRESSWPTPATVARIGAVAGTASAIVLVVNAAKRAEVLPTTALTQLVAPLAQILAIALVTGLYVAVGKRTGKAGLVAYLLNSFALAALVGVEFVVNLVFAELPDDTIDELRAGPLGAALVIVSVLFLLGSLAFAAVLLASGEIPRIPAVLYAAAAVPIALRAFVPDVALNLGLVMLAVAVAWLAAWLFSQSRTNYPVDNV